MARIMQPGGQLAILDVPNQAKQSAAERYRRGQLLPAEYERLYARLPHCYYAQGWFQELATALGLSCQLFAQELPGYGNAPYRFNVLLDEGMAASKIMDAAKTRKGIDD